MARADDLRAYVRRDWAALAAVKRAAWVERRRRGSVDEAMKIADELRRQAHAAHPDWPTAAEREADLQAHIRLAEILRRASPARKR